MKKTIHIFDMDNTLIKTPSFFEFLGVKDGEVVDFKNGKYSDYFKHIKSEFWNRLSKNVIFVRSGDFLMVIDADTKKTFNDMVISEYFTEKKWTKVFGVKDGVVTLETPSKFYQEEATVTPNPNSSVAKKYIAANNKMIITGRAVHLRYNIEMALSDSGLEQPNYGLYLFPGGKHSIKEWKSRVIINSIKEESWDEVHFYEDKPSWLYYAEGVVNKEFPKVKFVPHLITDVEDNMSL